jgi:RNA polymerase sigma-70 factor (ECF subfamily)
MGNMASTNESEAHHWIALLRTGGRPREAAVTQIYRRYGAAFERYFRRNRATDAQAEDLVQEVFIKMIRAIDSYKGEGAFEAWLWSIARNTLISAMRQTESLVELDAMETSLGEALLASHSGTATDPAARDCVRRAFDEFAQTHREYAEVLTRVVVDGWGYEELATFRGSGNGAAREYLSQCRKRLSAFIQPCLDLIEGRLS